MLKVATGTHPQYLALQADGPPALVSGDPGVLHIDSFAKYAVAFFKISRSILTRASSALSRASSICSALTGLVPAPASLPSAARRTQLPSVGAGTPRILAVTALACPPCTRRTASSLNSSVYAALLPFSVIISHLLYRQLYTRLRSTFFRGNLMPVRPARYSGYLHRALALLALPAHCLDLRLAMPAMARSGQGVVPGTGIEPACRD